MSIMRPKPPVVSIEGNPFIIRFKTDRKGILKKLDMSIEGNPFIIRFKTFYHKKVYRFIPFIRIEGNPFIIRFKT